MNVKVSRRALENTLKILLEQDGDSPGATVDPSAAPVEQKSVSKSLEDQFRDKVAELQKMKSGDDLAIGDRKFKKKAGAFYLSGAQEGMSTETLLSLIRPEFRDEVQKKLEKSIREKTDSAGVTIMGNQFIDSTERSATFKYGGTEGGATVWEDMSGIPAQVIAQYYFQVEGPGEIGSDVAGSIAADVLGPTGAQVLTYRSDELMIVIDPSSSNMYVMSAEYNDYDPLLATKTLLTQIKLNDKVGDDPNDDRQGTKDYPAIRSGYNTYLKPDGSGEKYSVPLRNFDLGDLRKAIGSTRTIFSKFFDLFKTDDIEMNFVFSPWGPSMMRSKVFGSDAFGGGTGAMTPQALSRLKDTGLFREETLLPAGTGTYNVRTDRSQDLVALIEGKAATPVTVTPVSGITGARVDGLKGPFGVLYTEDDAADTYNDTFGDAYLLYMNGAMSAERPREEEAAGATAVPPAGTDPSADPLAEMCAKSRGVSLGMELKNKAALFQFGKTDYLTSIAGFDPQAYIDMVAAEIILFYDKHKAYYSDDSRKIDITVIGTADQRGEAGSNLTLSSNRCAKFIRDLNTELGPQVAPKCNVSTVAVGEEFWRGLPDKEPESTRAYKRFVKVYWCKLDPGKAGESISDYVRPVSERAAAAESGETGSAATKVDRASAGGDTKEVIDAAVSATSKLTSLGGLMLTDGNYVYKIATDGSVKISGGPKKLQDFVWSRGAAGNDKWTRFVAALFDTSKMTAIDGDKVKAGEKGYKYMAPEEIPDDTSRVKFKIAPDKIITMDTNGRAIVID